MKNTFRLFLVIVSLLVVLVPASLFAAEDCSRCHKDVQARGRKGRVIHQPFMKGQCGQCHLVGKSVTAPVKKSPLVVKKQQMEKIRWFQTISGRDQEHWLRVPAESMASGLYLKATDGRVRSSLQTVTLPKNGSVPQKLDDHRPPLQSSLRVADVRRGISTTATLQWETDEYTDSTIHYGIGNLRSRKVDRQLTRRHSLVLLGLDADKTYQYQIISRDLFGNETTSAVMEFSTEKSFWDEDAHYSALDSLATDIKLQTSLFRVKNEYLVVVKADRPVSLSLGTENKVKSRNTEERHVAATAGQYSHPILKSSLDTNITICKDCHQNVREEYSHPIKVRARKGMVIPSEYPVLPDGKMSCMTCHDNHSSNHAYRLRKSNKADLCRGCHHDY